MNTIIYSKRSNTYIYALFINILYIVDKAKNKRNRKCSYLPNKTIVSSEELRSYIDLKFKSIEKRMDNLEKNINDFKGRQENLTKKLDAMTRDIKQIKNQITELNELLVNDSVRD